MIVTQNNSNTFIWNDLIAFNFEFNYINLLVTEITLLYPIIMIIVHLLYGEII